MAASSKTRKTAEKKQRSTAKNWRRERGEDLELPSGNVAYVKRPGPALFLEQGVLPDTLTPIVMEAVKKGKGLKPEALDDLSKDPKTVLDMLDAMDRVLSRIVLEPRVQYHRRPVLDASGEEKRDINGKTAYEDIPEDERDTEEFIYTDEVDLEDKIFLFGYAVGGTRDLERFRQEHGESLGNLGAVEGDEDPA